MPGPIALPAIEVPAPRAVTGTRVARATSRAAADLGLVARADDRPRRDAVERGVGGVHRPGRAVVVDLEPVPAQGGAEVRQVERQVRHE